MSVRLAFSESGPCSCVPSGGGRRSALAARRFERGLSQEDLADRVGVAVRTVRTWESGERMPFPAHRRELAAVLGVDMAGLGRLLSGRPLEDAPAVVPASDDAVSLAGLSGKLFGLGLALVVASVRRLIGGAR